MEKDIEIEDSEEQITEETLTELSIDEEQAFENDLIPKDQKLIEKKELDKLLKSKVLLFLKKESAKYLDINNGSLAIYSPKYLSMIKNMVRSPGSVLVYSQFKSLQGLYTFALTLEQTGEYQPFRIKKVGREWQLDETDWDINKKRFIFYAGGEHKELRDVYLKIFNSQWDRLDSSFDSVRATLESKFGKEQNLYGKVINVFLTTRTGAEGIDLKHVRQVHLMEPYWQPVLMEQVIGRAVRTNSHIRLPEKDRNVEVFFYLATMTPAQVENMGYVDVKRDICKFSNDVLGKYNKFVTTDEYIYILAKKKEVIIQECQRLIRESAFDCSLFYKDNIKMQENTNMRCLDFPSKDRGDYLFVPSLADTEELMELGQEKMVEEKYTTININGKTYYHPKVPDASGKIYLYDENFITKVRTPKPVGIVYYKDGKKMAALKKKKI